MNELLLFVELAQIENADHRLDKLSEMTAGNPALRARLEELLDAHQRASAFLPTSHHLGMSGQPTSIMPEAENVGTMIGPYKLLQEIGEGGMGTVFMAEQSKPVQRRVALKIIKAGMDTRQVIARFEAERQALALMDHPNIAKVLDAGATTTGRPYFVMELVKGVPLTKYCDDKQLPLRERLELFIQVCQAIQHAHQKGIIHRDIKPTNVLVAQYDGKPIPKVIDFGVAKATAQKLTEKTMFTEFGMVIGTVEYMSPEQAEVNQLDIDTRSDVYSLGVMLYELLTGTTPLESKKLRSAAHAEMLRMIREEEPSRPSIKLSTSETLPSIAASRGTDPIKLKKYVAGELDWIVMKTLEKERARRYGTATELGEDLTRYLNDEAVLACPPSRGYQFRRFVRKNRAAVATASLIGAAVLLGICGLALGLYQARVERGRAIAAADKESIARKAAERAEEETLGAFRAATDDAIEKLIGSKDELGDQERDYLEGTLKRWQEFAARQGNDERSTAIRAEGHYRVGLLMRSLGQSKAAQEQLQQARNEQSGLLQEHAVSTAYRRALAQTAHELGILQLDLGDSKSADQNFETAFNIRQQLLSENPMAADIGLELVMTVMNQGNSHRVNSRWIEARKKYELSLQLRNELQARGVNSHEIQAAESAIRNNLGIALKEGELVEESLKEYTRASEIIHALWKAEPQNINYETSLLSVRNNTASTLRALNRLAEAKAEFEACLAMRASLCERFPAVAKYQTGLALTHFNLGTVHGAMSDVDGAQKHFCSARDQVKEALRRDPDKAESLTLLARSQYRIAGYLESAGKHEEARRQFEEAIATCESLRRLSPNTPSYVSMLASNHHNLANVFVSMNQAHEAKKECATAIALLSNLVREHSLPDFQLELASSHYALGRLLRSTSEFEEAQTELRAAVHWLQPLATKHTNTGRFQNELAEVESVLASVLFALKKIPEGAAMYETSIANYELLVTRFPKSATYLRQLGNTLANFGGHLVNDGQHAAGLRQIDHGIDRLSNCAATWGMTPNVKDRLQNAYRSRGNALKELKKYDAAAIAYERSLELDPSREDRIKILVKAAQNILDSGDSKAGLSYLEKLLALGDLPDNVHYNIGCAYSIASKLSPTDHENLVLLAVNHLRIAIQKGYRELKNFETDDDLDPIRDREDFKKLISELRDSIGNKEAAPPPAPSNSASKDD